MSNNPSDSELTGAYQSPSSVPFGERFTPGTILDNRYRVVAALGKGGMGEVYRADDLTLGQPVALKFLPAHLANDPDRLQRFRKEVAAARKVAHPNVCRVYDIVDHDGHSFLTMEFVDGEDLASVLRRMGRVPEEKGIEIVRQLCSALAAVHDQGMLHRDLKPANVMLDGRGKVRLTDFGLAAAAEDLSATEARSGTPLYMAPEQLAGQEVSTKSDLYALGLVLYELFTGKRAFTDAKRDTPPSKPSSHVSVLNPAIERVILKCLETDPNDRPRSAVEVFASLPGGDPLAAALAAGETPSPRLVADAGGVGGLSLRTGGIFLGLVVALLFTVLFLSKYTHIANRVEMPKPPEELARDAETVLHKLGYPGPYDDRAFGFEPELRSFTPIKSEDAPSLPVSFWHRTSPGVFRPLVPLNATELYGADYVPTTITRRNPPALIVGMTIVRLDPKGALIAFQAITEPMASEATAPPEAATLFAAIGQNEARFGPPSRLWPPPPSMDRLVVSWETQAADEHPTKIEATAQDGRWVYCSVTKPGMMRVDLVSRRAQAGDDTFGLIINFFAVGVLIFSVLRFILRKRVDWKGVLRLGIAIAILNLLHMVLSGSHRSYGVFFTGVVMTHAPSMAVLVLIFYMAIESTARKTWPQSLVSWSRLLAGRFTDPMVGRDTLIGTLGGLGVVVIAGLPKIVLHYLGEYSDPFQPAPMESAGQLRQVIGLMLGLIPQGISMTFAILFVYVLGRVIVRTHLLTVWALSILVTMLIAFIASEVANPLTYAINLTGGLLATAIVIFLYCRFGLLTTATGFVCMTCCTGTAWITSDPSAWYFYQGLVPISFILCLALYGFYFAAEGRQLIQTLLSGND